MSGSLSACRDIFYGRFDIRNEVRKLEFKKSKTAKCARARNSGMGVG